MNENNVLLIQHLATNNPPSHSVLVPKVSQSRHPRQSGDCGSQNRQSTGWAQNRQPQSLSLCFRRERSPISSKSQSSSRTHEIEGEETRRRGRSPRHNDRAPRHREESNTQRFKDLDAKIDTINIGTKALVTVDTLIRQTKLPFI